MDNNCTLSAVELVLKSELNIFMVANNSVS